MNLGKRIVERRWKKKIAYEIVNECFRRKKLSKEVLEKLKVLGIETKEREKIVEKLYKKYGPLVSEHTFRGRHKEIWEKLEEYLKKMPKKIVVNDIGYGELGFEEGKRSKTFEPFEIKGMLEKLGKDFEFYGYTLGKAYKITKKYVKDERMKFGELDIVTGTPWKKAHLTICLNVSGYLDEEEKKFAMKNLVDSTLENGIIVTDIPPMGEGIMVLEKIGEVYIYRKLKAHG